MKKKNNDWTEKDERQYRELLKHVPRLRASPDFKDRLHAEIARRQEEEKRKAQDRAQTPVRLPLLQRRWVALALPLAAAAALAILLIARGTRQTGGPVRPRGVDLMARRPVKPQKSKTPRKLVRKQVRPRTPSPAPGSKAPRNMAARKKEDPRSRAFILQQEALRAVIRALSRDGGVGPRDGGVARRDGRTGEPR